MCESEFACSRERTREREGKCEGVRLCFREKENEKEGRKRTREKEYRERVKRKRWRENMRVKRKEGIAAWVSGQIRWSNRCWAVEIAL
jgi:hypothetical protein